MGRACEPRAPRQRRDGAQAGSEHGQPADGPGGPDRTLRRTRCHQPGSRGAAVPEQAHRRLPPPPDLREAGDLIEDRARVARARIGSRRLTPMTGHVADASAGSTRRDWRMTTLITPPTEADDSASGVAVHARAIARHYGEGETAVHALRGVDLDVQSEHLTAVMGPSGSGKSTLMHILAGLDQPSSGEVSVAGIVVGGLDDTALTQLRRDHIGFIFQFFNLLPMLTAAENIVLPLKLAGVKLHQEW